LASRITGWELDVRSREIMEEEMKSVLALKCVGKKVARLWWKAL